MSIFDCRLPSNWKREPIAANYRITKRPRKFAHTPNAPLPFIPMEFVPAGGASACAFELRMPGTIASGTYFEAGDVLLSKITPSFENGKQGLATDLPGAFGYGSTEIIPLQTCTDGAINLFLFYLLLHHEIRDSLASKMEGSTGRKRVPEGAVRELLIPVPPKAEQESIAAVLWKLQRAITTQDRLIANTRDLKQSAMQYLFTHGLRGEPRKDTEIGIAPGNWRVDRLIELAHFQRGFDITKRQQAAGTIPVVSSGGIRSWHSEVKVRGPGVVIGRKGSIGTVHYVESDYWPHDTTLWATDFRGNLPIFVFYRLSVLDLARLDSGAANPALNRNYLHEEIVSWPDVDEQHDIAAALTTIDQKLTHHQRKRTALNDLFQTLLHQLMTAQIRVADLDIDTSEVAVSSQGAAA